MIKHTFTIACLLAVILLAWLTSAPAQIDVQIKPENIQFIYQEDASALVTGRVSFLDAGSNITAALTIRDGCTGIVFSASGTLTPGGDVVSTNDASYAAALTNVQGSTYIAVSGSGRTRTLALQLGDLMRTGSIFRIDGQIISNLNIGANLTLTNVNGSGTLTASGSGSGGGITNVFAGAGSTGSVFSATADTNKFLRGDGTWQETTVAESDPVWSADKPSYATTASLGNLATTNVTQTAPSGTGSLVYSNSQFYFTPPSAAGLGSVTNVNLNIVAGSGITVNGGTSVLLTNNGSLTIASTAQATNDLRWLVDSTLPNTTNDLIGFAPHSFLPSQASTTAPIVDGPTLYNAATNNWTMLLALRYRREVTGSNLQWSVLRSGESSTFTSNYTAQVVYTNTLTGAAWSGTLFTNTITAVNVWTNHTLTDAVLTNLPVGAMPQLIFTVPVSATNGAISPAYWQIRNGGNQW